jgi:poly(A) polymerase
MASINLTPLISSQALVSLFDALETKGGEGCVRLVGGAVRDAVYAIAADDVDLATSLEPDAIEAALRGAGIKSLAIGKAHGTITALIHDQTYEITSLRQDVSTDGRHALVAYTKDWSQDAQRRDFYLNALYADRHGRIYDPTGEGLNDALNRRVRFIGKPIDRIQEDYLRIMRFFRFTSAYGVNIDNTGFEACVDLKSGLDGLSGERLWQELQKLMATPYPYFVLCQMQSGGILKSVLHGAQKPDAPLINLKAVIAITKDPLLRLAAILHDLGGLNPKALKSLRQRLKFSNQIFVRLSKLAEAVTIVNIDTMAQARHWLYHFGHETVKDALHLKIAQAHAGQGIQKHLDMIDAIFVPVFSLTGNDLMRLGVKAGPDLGARLKAIESLWVKHDFSQSVIDKALDEFREA